MSSMKILAVRRCKAGKLNHSLSSPPAWIFRFCQNFSDFRSNTVNIQFLGRTHSSALISGRGSGDLELEHSLSTSLKLLNNDRPPVCKIENFATINCEFTLSRLIAPWKLLSHQLTTIMLHHIPVPWLLAAWIYSLLKKLACA